MNTIQTTTLTTTQKEQILSLWNSVSPAIISHDTIGSLEGYLKTLNNAIYTLTLDDQETIVGWFADFDRDGARWFAMLLDASVQGKGIGSSLLTMAKKRHGILNGWVVDHANDVRLDGNPYKSPVSFYLKNGFEIVPDVRLELDYLSCVKMRWCKGK